MSWSISLVLPGEWRLLTYHQVHERHVLSLKVEGNWVVLVEVTKIDPLSRVSPLLLLSLHEGLLQKVSQAFCTCFWEKWEQAPISIWCSHVDVNRFLLSVSIQARWPYAVRYSVLQARLPGLDAFEDLHPPSRQEVSVVGIESPERNSWRPPAILQEI